MDCIFYTAKDIQNMLGISQAVAYKIIKSLNDELKKQGYITISGRVSRKYFMEKVYGAE